MKLSRRALVKGALLGSALVGARSVGLADERPAGTKRTWRRIAVEEEFSTFEILMAQRRLLGQDPRDEPGFTWEETADVSKLTALAG